MRLNMADNKKIQDAVKTIFKYCNKQNKCEEGCKCILYKQGYGCIVEIPDNWNIGEFMLTDYI